MKENYLIEITNRKKIDDEIEELTLTTKGSYVTKDGKRYLMYKEFDPEGAQEQQTSTLKIDDSGDNKVVSLIRNDPNRGRTNLMLEQGKRHLCQYGTTFGCLTLGVFTSKIEDHLTDDGGSLLMEYTLDINTNLSSINSIAISIRPSA